MPGVKTPVTVYVRVGGSENKYTEAFDTYGAIRSPNRGLGVEFGAEQLEGGLRVEGLPNVPSVTVGSFLRIMGQWFKIVGVEPRPPHGHVVAVECSAEREPEIAVTVTVGGDPIAIGGRRVAI